MGFWQYRDSIVKIYKPRTMAVGGPGRSGLAEAKAPASASRGGYESGVELLPGPGAHSLESRPGPGLGKPLQRPWLGYAPLSWGGGVLVLSP